MSKHTLQKAKEYCEEHKLRYTGPREDVLKALLASKKPLGAYDILECLTTGDHTPKPPTIYRAIDFWTEHGFIHKIESLNVFAACHAGHNHKSSQFIVCNDCGKVEEFHLCQMPQDLQNTITTNGFKMAHWSADLHGTCSQCP